MPPSRNPNPELFARSGQILPARGMGTSVGYCTTTTTTTTYLVSRAASRWNAFLQTSNIPVRREGGRGQEPFEDSGIMASSHGTDHRGTWVDRAADVHSAPVHYGPVHAIAVVSLLQSAVIRQSAPSDLVRGIPCAEKEEVKRRRNKTGKRKKRE